MLKKIPVIIGPTCSAKTSLAIKLAKLIDGEIIGLDSRQIYSGIPIGTAQPNEQELKSIKHHLIGCYELNKSISAGQYAELVEKKINVILNKLRNPIICGGAGLYFRALTRGIFRDSFSDLDIRNTLTKKYEKNPKVLLKKLKSVDPEYSKIVHINNKKRLVRALEIYESTGKTPSQHFLSQRLIKKKEINIFSIYLKWNQTVLDKRIILRAHEMLSQGWIEEVKKVKSMEKQYNVKYSCLDFIGYNQISSYLDGDISFKKMKEEIIIKTCQLSKKQWKWFKKEPINLFLDMDSISVDKIAVIVRDVITCI
ncbi:MAG: tRNA (adenosine(37)-N6)-dimethylallyltransferase MiaA [Candidatus Marinimicrobia bacterium]|nr:tRNA (adenosine(37)-N6)-dimethylallyltransferase MiaA [Candidatus Neomarinimicrobiota bacterium]